MPRPQRTKIVRYAVVGLGHLAQAAVLPAFAHAKRNSRLHAIVSGDRLKLATLGNKYDVPVRGSYAEFERCLMDVDAVYICTPNSEHAEYAVRAAQAGVHVLCEKPLGVTDAECELITRACRESGVKLMTAYRLHFESVSLEIFDLVRRGAIGQPRYFSSSFSLKVKPGGIRTRRATGGGTLFDLGVYCVNTARVLFGAEPTRVFASSVSGARAGMPEVDEMTSALLCFSGEGLATFTTSFAAGSVSAFRIVGAEGDIHVEPAYDYNEPLAYTLTVGDRVTAKKGRRRDQFAAELLCFSACILQDREPEASGEEGARDVRIVNALYESARTGRAIDLPDLPAEPAPNPDQAHDVPPIHEPSLVRVPKPQE